MCRRYNSAMRIGSALLSVVLAVASLQALPSAAQAPRGRAAAVKPYKPVPVKLPAAPDDPK